MEFEAQSVRSEARKAEERALEQKVAAEGEKAVAAQTMSAAEKKEMAARKREQVRRFASSFFLACFQNCGRCFPCLVPCFRFIVARPQNRRKYLQLKKRQPGKESRWGGLRLAFYPSPKFWPVCFQLI
jgi:hypothetical protein